MSTAVAAASVAIGVVVVGRARPESLEEWANVGQAFGALSAVVAAAALVALIFTFAAQQHEMREHRGELKLQAESLAHSGQELHCSTEASLAMYHLDLLRMAIEQPHLADVWPDLTTGLTVEAKQQYLYCTLILNGVWLNRRTGRYDDADVRAMVGYLATSPILRAYWDLSRNNRSSAVAPDGPESDYFNVVDELFQDGL